MPSCDVATNICQALDAGAGRGRDVGDENRSAEHRGVRVGGRLHAGTRGLEGGDGNNTGRGGHRRGSGGEDGNRGGSWGGFGNSGRREGGGGGGDHQGRQSGNGCESVVLRISTFIISNYKQIPINVVTVQL